MGQVCARGCRAGVSGLPEVIPHDLCTGRAVGSPWVGMIPLYLGFLHFALMFPASQPCWLCLTCCCPAGSAEHWGPLGQCLTPPVMPCSQGLSPGSLQGASQVLHEWLKTCLCCVGAFLAVTCGWKVSGARWKPPSQEKWGPLSDPWPQHRQLCSSLASPCQGLTL